jgi:acetyltransferase-like isoleucine patch superfamily enzyme
MMRWIIRLVQTQIYWRLRFGKLGWRTVVFKPMLISGASRIFLGSRSQIREFARLEVISRPNLGWEPCLKIGNRVNIEQGVHIVCQCDIVIEDEVSITPYCAIVDTYHPHDPPDLPPKIGARLPTERTFVHIGAGTFVGMKTIILPNVRIGRGCVIGAGSVVDKDIPDYAMAAGSPVRIVSIFDQTTRSWS